MTFDEVAAEYNKLIKLIDETKNISIAMAVADYSTDDKNSYGRSYANYSIKTRNHAAMLMAALARTTASGARKNGDTHLAELLEDIVTRIDDFMDFDTISKETRKPS